MLHTSTLWMRAFQLLIQCWSRVGEVRGGFWLRGAVVGSGLALLMASGTGWAATEWSAAGLNTTNGQEQTVAPPAQTAKAKAAAAAAMQALHQEEEWMMVSKYLPSLEHGSSEALETAGDVLRARRFPQEALEYYLAAYRKGANRQQILNKMGVTELGMRHPTQARVYFKQVVKVDKRDSNAWNNLGATEYVDGHYGLSVADYRKALKLNPGSAVFHSNLGTALIGEKNFEDARKEFAAALDLDPDFGSKSSDSTGVSAHVLSAEDRAQFCLALARAYAAKGKIDAMLRSLAMAVDGGADLAEAMMGDPALEKYRKSPEVLLLIENSKAIKKRSVASVEMLSPLPPAKN